MTSIQNITTQQTNIVQNNKNNTQPNITDNTNYRQPQVKNLSNVTVDYNVKTPIKYKFIQDIKLNDNLIAKHYKLANGQNIVIVPKDGPTVVKTYVNTGSFNEKDNIRGISHYIEHNLFNGSEDLGEKVFFDEVNKMGANTNASTSFSVTDYYISSNLLEDTDLKNSIELHAGMLQSPKFILDKLEKEKKIVNSEINMYMAEDENIGYTQTIKNLFNIKSTSLDLVAGTTDNITTLTKEDVVKYFNENYYPANMTTVITGDVNPEETINLVSKYFTSKKTPQTNRYFEKMIPIEKPIRQDIISSKTEGQATIFLGFAGPENNNSMDKLKLNALKTLFSELSNSRIADIEKKYGIDVYSIEERLSSNPKDKELIMVQTQIPEENVETYLKDLYKAIDEIVKNPPTDEEIEAIKSKLKKQHNKTLEMSHTLNYYVGNSFLNNNITDLEDYSKNIDNISQQDLIETAKKYLNLNKVAITVVHPGNVTESEVCKNYETAKNISFKGANKKTPIDINSIEKQKLSNNIEVVFNNVNTDNVTYQLNIKKRNWDVKTASIADVLSEMLKDSGTEQNPLKECSQKEDRLGLTTYIASNHYGLSQVADFPVENSKNALNYLKERIISPKFDEETFEKVVENLKLAYSTCEVSPYEKYHKVMYDELPAAYSPKDKLESLNNLTLEDVKTFYNDIMNTGMGQVVVTGPIKKNPQLKQEICDNLDDIKKLQPRNITLNEVYRPLEKTEVFTEVNKKNQAKILEGFKFKNTGEIKDKVCAELFNEIFGGGASSRLFNDLRETKHLAYSVRSGVNYTQDMGVLTLSIGTTTENLETGEKTFENLQKSIDGFNENIERIKSEKVSEEELKYAKRNLKSQILSRIETSEDKNNILITSDNTPYGVDYINKYFKMIDEITVEDIQAKAKEIFTSPPIYSITATQATIDANKDYLEKLV